MAQTGYTPILIYASGTASNTPLAANLTSSAAGAELALNYADGKLFYKDSGGVVQTLATKGTAVIGGSNNQVQYNSSGSLAGSANLVFDGTNLGIGTSSPFTRLDSASARTTTLNSIASFNTMPASVTDTTAFAVGVGGGINFRAQLSASLYATYAAIWSHRESATTNDYKGSLLFGTSDNGDGYPEERMRLDSSGNLGLGVTPSAWGNNYRALSVNNSFMAAFAADDGIFLGTNAYNNNTNWIYNVSDRASYYQQQSGQHQWYTAPSGTAGNAISFTQAMTLDASGTLTVAKTTNAQYNSIFGNLAIGTGSAFVANNTEISSGTNIGIGTTGAQYLALYTNSTERARITSGGDLLVGTTNTSGTTGEGIKSVFVTSTVPTVRCVGNDSTSTYSSYELYSTSAAAYRFYVNYAGTVFATTTTISAISDQRLKENVQDLDAGLDKIMALKPRKFDWMAGKGKDIKGDRGFIAQEFEQVFPDLIDEWKDPAPEGEEPYKSVRQDLIPVLVKAIQEQQALIESLTARIAALEAA